MEIMNAQRQKDIIHAQLKKEKFEKMLSIQQKKIEETMKRGEYNHCVWIFKDKEYYYNTLERSWYEEFLNKATKMFEDAGYSIKGIIVRW